MAFYNVENLFDTIDDPGVKDEEFTPEAKVPWTKERYKTKLKNISRALSTFDNGKLPVMIGLCEVENKNVIKDLLSVEPLNQPKYSFIHKDSPDERGIDVALLFDPHFFKPVYAEFIALPFSFEPTEKTRDILYVKGTIDTDTLHVFVNHWTSRWGGQQETEEFRVHTAGVMATVFDSLKKAVKHPNFIMMGDFNDNPDNISLAETLNAQVVDDDPENDELYNLSYQMFLDGEGTLYWKSWDMFDQFIVSGNLLHTDDGLQLSPAHQFIHKPDWILFEDNNGVKRPSRTKGSNAYYGGFSDHLPVYIYLGKKK
ncbi:MAG: endonuclease/exonuclease/phosphatase family protein [Bacteroidota bacterium]|nr:endonuclease/exonuclease/phosphatase family protein [Bacteroidota bacterium]